MRMIRREELDEMSKMDIRKIDRSTLVDIQTVEIDVDMPIAERMIKYLNEIKNPYCFLVGDVPVQVGFNENGKTIDELIKIYFKGRY